jgi:hypothetical protein
MFSTSGSPPVSGAGEVAMLVLLLLAIGIAYLLWKS